MMTLISWVNRIYGSMLIDWFHVIHIFSYRRRKLREMPGNTLKLSGKVREFYFAEPVGTLVHGAFVTLTSCVLLSPPRGGGGVIVRISRTLACSHTMRHC